MKKSALVCSFVAMAVMPVAGRASLITGVLNTTGSATISFGNVSFSDVAGTVNTMDINSPGSAQQGGFSALAGTTISIQPVTNMPTPVGARNVPDFITFSTAPNISITLTYLFPGFEGSAGCTLPAAAPPPLQGCTPPNSPFNLENTNPLPSSTASFQILGTEVDSSTGLTAPVSGTFTTQFANMDYQQLVATIMNGGTVTASSVSASLTVGTPTATPEPGTLTLLLAGTGLVGLALVYRRRSARA